jgi:DnaJ-domain-containing protein 1
MKDYYQILSIAPNASLDVIKHSFRVLAHKYHPDKNSITESAKFIEIKEAYDALIDEINRKKYDELHKIHFGKNYNNVSQAITIREINENPEIYRLYEHIKNYNSLDFQNIVIEDLCKDLKNCLQTLNTLYSERKISSDAHEDISSTIVRNAISVAQNIMKEVLKMCILEPVHPFDKVQKNISYEVALDWLTKINKYVISPLEGFVKNSYTLEVNTLNQLYFKELQLNLELGSSVKQYNKKCFIATMAYENEEHINVKILRLYRDNILLKNVFGRILISSYYIVSPTIVQIIKDNRKFVRFTRRALDKIVDFIISK